MVSHRILVESFYYVSLIEDVDDIPLLFDVAHYLLIIIINSTAIDTVLALEKRQLCVYVRVPSNIPMARNVV